MGATLELTEREVTALLLLLKLGMDMYTGNDPDPGIAALHGVPYSALDSLVAKVSLAGGRAVRGDA